MAFRLIVDSEGRKDRFELESGENLLGSDPGCSVFLPLPGISRHHAILLVVDREVQVADLGSQNGTLVNGRPVGAKARVGAETQLTFGTVSAVLEWKEEDDRAAAVSTRFPEVDGAPSSHTPAPDGPVLRAPATTTSIGPLHVFTLARLPGLVEALSLLGREDRVQAAELVGEALQSSLPCRDVEIILDGGVLYRSGSPSGEGTVSEVDTSSRGGSPLGLARQEVRGFEVAAEFETAGAGQLFGPILQTAGHLLVWSLTSRAARRPVIPDHHASPDRTSGPELPPLPSPVTVHSTLR